MGASLQASHSIRALLLARLYVVKYLLSTEQEDASRAYTEFKNMQGELAELD